jgi:hypothetical protein
MSIAHHPARAAEVRSTSVYYALKLEAIVFNEDEGRSRENDAPQISPACIEWRSAAVAATGQGNLTVEAP